MNFVGVQDDIYMCWTGRFANLLLVSPGVKTSLGQTDRGNRKSPDF